MNKINIQLSGSMLFTLIPIILLIGMTVWFTVYWFGGEREADNEKDALLQWTQKAIVMEKTNHWWGTSCLLEANDGKRYYEDSCSRYINGDKVTILMYEDRYRWIEGLA